MEMRVGGGAQEGPLAQDEQGGGGGVVVEIMAFQAEGTACAKQGVRVDPGG